MLGSNYFDCYGHGFIGDFLDCLELFMGIFGRLAMRNRWKMATGTKGSDRRIRGKRTRTRYMLTQSDDESVRRGR
jgi:hypothetical protein